MEGEAESPQFVHNLLGLVLIEAVFGLSVTKDGKLKLDSATTVVSESCF